MNEKRTHLSLLDEIRSTKNDDAWHRFVEIYEELIHAWLRRAGLQQADVDDVYQEVLATIHREIPHFQHNGRVGAFRNWLRQITVHRMRRLWSQKSLAERNVCQVNLAELANELEDDRSRLTLLWEQQHDKAVLSKLLEQLSAQFRPKSIIAFRRVGLEGEDARQVAADLNMTLGAVQVARHRVLTALKELAGALVD